MKTKIVIHCADTPNGDNRFDIEDIDQWHQERAKAGGMAWRTNTDRAILNYKLLAIGYHWVICCDGRTQRGRHDAEVGSHARGANTDGLGICLIGKDKFTREQWDELRKIIQAYHINGIGLEVLGHYQIPNANKPCPNFDVEKYVANDYNPEPDWIYAKV